MKFIVIEGLDGSGKSTQLNLLMEHLTKMGQRFKYLHFPRLDSAPFGQMVARFLRGEFGSLESVNPYLVALIYAEDRNDAKKIINQWMDEGYLVIVDRYVHSNIAYQCAKSTNTDEVEKLKDWILDLEFNYFGIPKPDLNVLLDVPFVFTENKLKSTRTGADRDYLQGKTDIHEQNLDFQKRVREMYLMSVKNDKNFRLIDCSDGTNMLPPEVIFDKIKNTLFG